LRIQDLNLPTTRGPYGHDLDVLSDYDLPDPVGWNILALQYRIPERLDSGLYVAYEARKNDEWQGRCGMVLALGPDAYRDRDKYPTGPWVKPGDMILWSMSEATVTRFTFGTAQEAAVLCTIYDDKVTSVNVDPTLANRK
jgi:hypothetical protein